LTFRPRKFRQLLPFRPTNIPSRDSVFASGWTLRLVPLAIRLGDAENRRMSDDQATAAAAPRHAAFAPGAVVLVTLSSPREKFWGVLLEISGAGLSLRGLDLNSFEDFVHLVRAGEPATPAAVFFPMHRVERMEADEHCGDIPSLKERFQEKTGRPLAYLFGRYGE
jgi:hypothetical protein